MKNQYICPKCKSKNWRIAASDADPNNRMKCADCGYESTFLIGGKK